MRAPRNAKGGPLEPCSFDPVTGYFRDGCCDTGPQDAGSHTVCAIMTDEFLAYSRYLGNDLTTPRPEFDFRGLRSGDRWCICASRFLQAAEEGAAPKVVLAATNVAAFSIIPREVLEALAVDLDKPGLDKPGRD